MRHMILTCKNYPKLRWTTKECRNRSIFFDGEVKYPIEYFFDKSGIETTPAQECSCPISDLITAPEDAEFKRVYEKRWFHGN